MKIYKILWVKNRKFWSRSSNKFTKKGTVFHSKNIAVKWLHHLQSLNKTCQVIEYECKQIGHTELIQLPW